MALQRKSPSKNSQQQELIALASKRLQQPDTEFNKIANTWALELEKDGSAATIICKEDY
jgi:hypothetical protein